MTDSASQNSIKINNGFHLSITFDADNRVLSATVNDISIAPGTLDCPATSASYREEEGNCCDVEIPESRKISFGVLKTLLGQTAIAAVVVVLLQYLVYRYLFHDPDFVKRYGWWLLYLDLSIIPLVTSIVYLRSFFYARMSHMMGMMIGMTIGMQVGTMIGAVIGATNGFFVGALAGMSAGVAIALYAAWCCGPMAVMHGLMGSIMGGTMGAMIIVMMMMDHVLIFMPVFTVLNIAILAWFIYMYSKECCCTANLQIRKPVNPYLLAFINVLSVGLISALMIYGPKGPGSWMGEPADMSASNESCIDDTGNPFAAKAWQKPCKTKGPVQMACGAMMMNGGGGK
jgi:hypothetical protein